MRVCSLGSGSKGNTAIVESSRTTLLVDCGFSARDLEKRLEAKELRLGDIDAVLITHEHIDHIRGLRRLSKLLPEVPVHMTRGTAHGLGLDEPAYRPIRADEPFDIDGIRITPFAVPHDAREPVQFKVSNGDASIGFLTDAGSVTAHAAQVLGDCSVLIVECNYDAQRLRQNRDYPQQLKERISGGYGHLGNGEARGLLKELSARRLRHVVAAHLSEQNNLPDLARDSLANCLPCGGVTVTVASQEHGFDWIEF